MNKISNKIEEENQKFYFNLQSMIQFWRKFRQKHPGRFRHPVHFSQNVGEAITDQEVFDELGESGLPLFDRSNLIPL